MSLIAQGIRCLRNLKGNGSGLAAIEFALGAPMLMVLGGYGVEVANLAISHMRVSQYALQLADNAARIGVNSGLSTFQVREADINDVMQGLRLFSGSTDLGLHGRVTLSSLENTQQTWDTAPAQRIHWQRCMGQRGGKTGAVDDTAYDSAYSTNKTDGTIAGKAYQGPDATGGIGPANAKINAPTNSAVMFVEVNYEYQPLFGSLFVGKTRLHYTASAIVRDKRDLSQIASNSGTAATCDLYNA